MGVMANIIPQFGTLWPSLTPITGTDYQTKEGKATAWAKFFASGGEHAVAFKDERVKSAHAAALASAGLTDNPPVSELFKSQTEGFGAGVRKLHHQAFGQIAILEPRGQGPARPGSGPPSGRPTQARV